MWRKWTLTLKKHCLQPKVQYSLKGICWHILECQYCIHLPPVLQQSMTVFRCLSKLDGGQQLWADTGKNGIAKETMRDFPGGPVVKNLPSNVGGAGSIPGWGTKIPQAMGQLSPCATATEPVPCNERSWVMQRNPATAARTWCSQRAESKEIMSCLVQLVSDAFLTCYVIWLAYYLTIIMLTIFSFNTYRSFWIYEDKRIQKQTYKCLCTY